MSSPSKGIVLSALLAVSVVLSGCGSGSTNAPSSPAGMLSATSLSFSTTVVGAVSTPQTVTLTNSGNATLDLTAVSVTGTNSSNFTIASNTCGSTLAASTSCTISVTFTPTSSATFTGNLSITDNAAGSPELVALSGVGYTGNYNGSTFSGHVMAGNLPVIGASVQLYAAGASGNGLAPIQLLQTAVTTSSTGAFTIPANYVCPFSISVVYLVSTGGHAGTSGATNAGTELMTSPGVCNTLANSTYTVNEMTTVASVYAFAQFMAPGAVMGASSTNLGGITLAYGTFANLVNIVTGVAPGPAFPSTGTAPLARLNAIADLINACVTSSGPTSTSCTGLYTGAETTSPAPANTLDAALNIARNPANNVTELYTLASGSNVYTPIPAAPPEDWTMFNTFTGGGMNAPSGVAIDSKGRVWVANYFYVASLFTNTGTPVFATGITGSGLCYAYGAAVDANDNVWIPNEPGGCGGSSVSVLNSSGVSVGGAPFSAGGLNFPTSVAIDTNNEAWVVNYGDSTVTLLTNAGAPLSGTTGFNGLTCSQPTVACESFIFPDAVAVDSNRNAYVGNQSSNTIVKVAPDGSSYTSFTCCDGASTLAVDGSNNVWTANYYGNTVSLISASGKIVSGTNGFASNGSLYKPQGLAIDGLGNAWIVNYHSPSGSLGDAITELAGASASSPGASLTSSTGLGTDAGMEDAYALAIDAGGNVWISSFATNSLMEFVGMAAPVKTPLVGPVRVP